MYSQLPEDIQDKIWNYVLDDWREEHKSKFFQNIAADIEKATTTVDYYMNINTIAAIEDPAERYRQIVSYLNEQALQGNILISATFRYNEIIYKGVTVSSLWKDNFINGRGDFLYSYQWGYQESREDFLRQMFEIEPDRDIYHTWIDIGTDVLFVPIQLRIEQTD